MCPQPTEQTHQTHRQAEHTYNETHTGQNMLTSFHASLPITRDCGRPIAKADEICNRGLGQNWEEAE